MRVPLLHTPPVLGHTEGRKGRGTMMKEEELLQYVHKTADMGCEGIVTVLDYVEDQRLKETLKGQMEGYKALKTEAERLLKAKGVEPNGVGAMAKVSTEVMSAGKLLMDRSPSKIAEMTIQGNNMGVSKTLQHLHDYHGGGAAKELAQRLLSAEESGTEQLKAFL